MRGYMGEWVGEWVSMWEGGREGEFGEEVQG